jgi:hypothetical protein
LSGCSSKKLDRADREASAADPPHSLAAAADDVECRQPWRCRMSQDERRGQAQHPVGLARQTLPPLSTC